MRRPPEHSSTHTQPPAPTVLLIEDEPTIADVMQLVLEDEGYRVIWRGRGRAGLDEAVSRHPDAIVLDLMLPDIDGWLVLHTLKSDPKTRDIPVIIASAAADWLPSDERELAECVLPKPFGLDELLTAVDGAANSASSQVSSPNQSRR